MKKNISINISGIIFHIEEDGYASLQAYLESITAYFSSYEDSKEIIADIENRIAEIFLSKLDDGKQIITVEDVDALIATMGTTSDFEAIEEEEETTENSKESTAENEPKEEGTTENVPPKRLERDEKRRVFGGVAAGMAHYFGIDALWVRLIILLMFFNVLFGPISGFVLIAYVVLWIVIPGSYDLEVDKSIKKMYRDPDHRVLGGVASGIAAYFGIDITVVRLLFLVSIFFGVGIIAYIILWIITPEAKTITEKMEMQGEPVTLSNIEHNVKEKLNVNEGEESTFVKILLFPFRAIAAIFQALGKLLGPISTFLVEALRVAAGIVITMIGLGSLTGLIVSTAVMLGFVSTWGHMAHINSIPLDLVRDSFPTFGYIAIFLASFIPFLLVTLLGISILVKRIVFNAAVGWSMFGLWVIGLIGIAYTVPKVVSDFSSEGEYRESVEYRFNANTINIGMVEAGMEHYDMVNLKIRGHEDSVLRLDMKFSARGNSRRNAGENAQMVSYEVNQKGTNLFFDSNLTFKEDAAFRVQELYMTLYVPYGQVFTMEEDLKYIVNNTINYHGYKTWQMEDNQWVFTEDDLKCLTCAEEYDDDSDVRNMDDEFGDDSSMIFDMDDFDEIEVDGNIKVVIASDRS